MREGNRAVIAGRQTVFEQDRGWRGSQRYGEKFIKLAKGPQPDLED